MIDYEEILNYINQRQAINSAYNYEKWEFINEKIKFIEEKIKKIAKDEKPEGFEIKKFYLKNKESTYWKLNVRIDNDKELSNEIIDTYNEIINSRIKKIKPTNHDKNKKITEDTKSENKANIIKNKEGVIKNTSKLGIKDKILRKFIPETFSVEINDVGIEKKEFNSSISITNKNIRIKNIKGFEKFGLKFENNRIIGLPNTSTIDEQNIECEIIFYHINDASKKEYIVTQKLNLLININPEEEWKRINKDLSDRFYKPEESYDKHNDLRNKISLIGSSIRGRAHIKNKKFRDDDFIIQHLNNDWYLTVVCDGAGSCKLSRWGSLIACKAVSEVLNLQNDKLEEIVSILSKTSNSEKINSILEDIYFNCILKFKYGVRELINLFQKKNNFEYLEKDFSTTLLVAVLKRINPEKIFISYFKVGDGEIVLSQNDSFDNLTILGKTDKGSYSGETNFITSIEFNEKSSIHNRFGFEILNNFHSIICATDGITDPKYDQNQDKIQCWNEILHSLKENCVFTKEYTALPFLTNWINFMSAQNHDDRTITIIHNI